LTSAYACGTQSGSESKPPSNSERMVGLKGQ
jgi:hypothetical protein